MKARFENRCPRCKGTIQVDAEIERTDSGYAHRGCAPAMNYSDPVLGPMLNEITTRQAERTIQVTEPGIYEHDGKVYRVKLNKTKTRLYAERLIEIGGERLAETSAHVNIDFEYTPGAIFAIKADEKMPIDRARPLILRYGRCLFCKRHLKDATSVENGVGPICIKRYGLPTTAAQDDDPAPVWEGEGFGEPRAPRYAGVAA